MDIKLLFVKSITLLYLESQLEQKGESRAKPAVRTLLAGLKMPDMPVDSGAERGVLTHLRTTLLWMINNDDSQAYDPDELLQRLRMNTQGDDSTYDALRRMIKRHDDQTVVSRQVATHMRDLQRHMAQERLNDVLKQAAFKVAFKQADITDWRGFILSTAQDLLSIDMGGDVKADPAFVSSVDFSDPNSVEQAFHEMEEVMSTDGIIKFPFKGLNRMMGSQAGGRRGEFGLVNALPHNYKSGTMVDLFIGACLYNDPYLFDKSRKPLILFYSTEDDVPVIIQKIYVILKQLEHGTAINIKGLNKKEAAEYVISKLQSRGWNVNLHRVRGSMFSYAKYIAHLEEYRNKGFEVAAVFCDYLAMFNREGCVQGAQGDDLQDLYKRVREYTSAMKILHMTAHQLSTQAKEEKRVNPEKFIFQMPGNGYYQGCKKLDTEVDFEFYINKQIVANGAFLEFLWGKHRKVEPTPETHKYFAYRYYDSPMYGLPYDFEGEIDLSCKSVGARSAAQGGGRELFDLDMAA